MAATCESPAWCWMLRLEPSPSDAVDCQQQSCPLSTRHQGGIHTLLDILQFIIRNECGLSKLVQVICVFINEADVGSINWILHAKARATMTKQVIHLLSSLPTISIDGHQEAQAGDYLCRQPLSLVFWSRLRLSTQPSIWHVII